MAVTVRSLFAVCLCLISIDNNIIVVYCSEVIDHRTFLGQLFREYGRNGSISVEEFARLYKDLGLASSSLDGTISNSSASDSQHQGCHLESVNKHNECNTEQKLSQLTDLGEALSSATPRHCLSFNQMLATYGLLAKNSSLSPLSFIQICPALIYKLDSRLCSTTHGHDERPTSQHSWMYAMFMIILISLAGILCVYLIPLLQKAFFIQLNSFLVPLAIGTLLGDAFLHLIPHALEVHEGEGHNHVDSVLKTGVVFLTVVVFFTFEGALKINKSKKEQCQDQVHYVSVDINNCEKEMVEMEKSTTSHGHSHSTNSTIPMILIGDFLHNFMDGLAIGAAFAGGDAAGLATSLAIFIHELPHEIGDSAVLLESGMSLHTVILSNVLMSGISMLGAVLGLIVGNLHNTSPWIYAATAGSFIYISLANLVPEVIREQYSWRGLLLRLVGFVTGGVIMCFIALFEHDIQDWFDSS